MNARKTAGSRRTVTSMVALTALLVVGGAIAAPLAGAADTTAEPTSTGAIAGRWEPWRPIPAASPTGQATDSGPGSFGATATVTPTTCVDVELVFARGTGERQGLGIVGTPLARALRTALPGKTVGSYAVLYAAAQSQASAGPGATDMSEHIASVAASCPKTRFVIGGYSQGATVTDIAIGITGVSRTRGTTIPAKLSGRVAAVVVFGNPLGMMRRTIAGSSTTYGPKAKEFCNTGDPVCGGGGNFAAHITYASNGSVTKAAQFAAGRIN